MDQSRGSDLRTGTSDDAAGAVLEQVDDPGQHVPSGFWFRALVSGQQRTRTPRQNEAGATVRASRARPHQGTAFRRSSPFTVTHVRSISGSSSSLRPSSTRPILKTKSGMTSRLLCSPDRAT